MYCLVTFEHFLKWIQNVITTWYVFFCSKLLLGKYIAPNGFLLKTTSPLTLDSQNVREELSIIFLCLFLFCILSLCRRTWQCWERGLMQETAWPEEVLVYSRQDDKWIKGAYVHVRVHVCLSVIKGLPYQAPCVKAGIPSRICHRLANTHTERNTENRNRWRRESRGKTRDDSELETQRGIQTGKYRNTGR